LDGLAWGASGSSVGSGSPAGGSRGRFGGLAASLAAGLAAGLAAEGGFEWRALRREVKSAFFPFFASREIAAASLATDPQMPLFRFAPRAAAAGCAERAFFAPRSSCSRASAHLGVSSALSCTRDTLRHDGFGRTLHISPSGKHGRCDVRGRSFVGRSSRFSWQIAHHLFTAATLRTMSVGLWY